MTTAVVIALLQNAGSVVWEKIVIAARVERHRVDAADSLCRAWARVVARVEAPVQLVQAIAKQELRLEGALPGILRPVLRVKRAPRLDRGRSPRRHESRRPPPESG